MPRKRRSPNALTLLTLRLESGWTKEELATALGFASIRSITRIEAGEEEPTREYLGFLVAPLGHPPEAVDALLFAFGLARPPALAEPVSPVALTPQERTRLHRAALTAGWTAAEEVLALLPRKAREEKIAAAHREAGELFEILQATPPGERRALIDTFPEYRSWALAVRVCEASVKAAAHRVDEALELADLAVFIAERVPGERLRLRLQGWCQAHLANALRVGNDFDGADAAFDRAWELWRTGEGVDPEILPEWRLLDLEASLRREQHRFPEALDLLDRARATSGAGTLATSRILMNRSHVLEQLGDFGGALRALELAAPAIEAADDQRLLFGLLFNTGANFRHLQRFAEAEALLPRIREIAVSLGDELHLIRVVWLTARVWAGTERREEAQAALKQVLQAFTARLLPYDAALAGLDLAVLWLEAGRSAEVQRLAEGMKWIFLSKKITREALASLSLFCEAARRETATVELALQVSAEIEAARRLAPRPKNGPGGRV
ncbi:MAG TPA: helix-turn-helix domain-containing protein [Thermoanaerobaculia bacterium]|nr:helix-turn-helix domain-containing protein [Thermoanaerobaculia bacterium]